MNHELWNEIGNLYFMHGAYEPAINAYLRSIKLENTFGRSYSNLAMAYVQTGNIVKPSNYTAAASSFYRTIRKKPQHGIGLAFYIARSRSMTMLSRPISGQT